MKNLQRALPSIVVAPVNLSTDLGDDSAALRTTAALRIADHHLNTVSIFIPDNETLRGNVEMFVVSQVCQTFPMENFKEKFLLSTSSSTSPVESKMWVQALGRTSIAFGHEITLQGKQLLALMTRIFIRKNVKTRDLVEITAQERTKVFPATPRKGIPQATKLEVPPEDEMLEVFSIRVGPQHCNNNHVDHAALADLVLQGLYIQDHSRMHRRPRRRRQHEGSLTMRYLAPLEMNETLSCFVHRDLPLAVLYRYAADASQVSVPVAMGRTATSSPGGITSSL